MSSAATKIGLRERKKLRTKQSIVDVASRLFLEQGYQQTTLVQIAEEAEVAPSTFFNYFPTKVDVVFCYFDAIIESAKVRILGRPEGEAALDAIVSWLREDLLDVEQPFTTSLARMPAVIASEPELGDVQRLRSALFEDVLAESFARDFDEPADGMRSRMLAALAYRGMHEVWDAWYAKHANDAEMHLEEVLEAKAVYLTELLGAALGFVDHLPEVPVD
jgi:AcrR family transcriptional regulator